MSGSRIPVTVVTGFLGAGKTTVLSHLIAESGGRRLAVAVNELGEASFEAVQGKGAEIRHGTSEDFAPMLRDILARDEIIDHVLVEAAGRALPAAIMAHLDEPEFKSHFVLDAVATVVDTPWLLALSADVAQAAAIDPLFIQQLAASDLAVLNKIDALADDDLSAAEARLRALG